MSKKQAEEPAVPRLPEWYVRYKCPDCGAAVTRIHNDTNRPPRTCNSPYGARLPSGKREYLRHGEVCGGILVIEEDRKLERVRA